jgi:hypothetical protein
MVLKSETRQAVVVKGKGAWLPSLPAVPVTDQLASAINSDDECWEATYSAPATRNANNVFRHSAVSRPEVV